MGRSHPNPLPEIAIQTLRKRREFVAMRNGVRQHRDGFLLQMRARDGVVNAGGSTHSQHQDANQGELRQCGIRVGYTVTKKVGNAVIRNRIKRRMREAVRRVLPSQGKPDHDYVLIGKRAALNMEFNTIITELGSALKSVHHKSTRPGKQHGK